MTSPAAVTVTFSAKEAATLQPNHVKEAKSLLDKDYRFAERMLSGTQDDTGGTRLFIPIKVQRHSKGVNLANGLTPLDKTAKNMVTVTQAGYAVYARQAWWSITDTIQQRGPAKQLDYLKMLTEDMLMGTLSDYEQQTWIGQTDDPDVMNDVTPINGDDDSTGILESAAVGLQDNVVQSFNKATWATLFGAQNQAYDGLNSASAYAWAATNAINIRVANHLKQAKSSDLRWWVSLEFAELWGRIMQPQERFVNVNAAETGGKTSSQLEFTIHGRPATVMNNMPIAGTVTTASPWSAVLLDHANIYFRGQSGFVKKVVPWVDIPGTPGTMVTFELLAGQNVFEYLGTSGVAKKLQQW